MVIRTRLSESTHTGSRVRKDTGASFTKTVKTISDYCEDETEGDNAFFTVTHDTRYGGFINGTESSSAGNILTEWPAVVPYGGSFGGHLTVPSRPSDGALAAEALARTNPFRSETVSLEYLSNLSDLGRDAHSEFSKRLGLLKRHPLFKRWAGLGKLAQANILYSFGISPLISDIELLMRFQERVDKRADEIERLAHRGLRRSIDLWSGSNQLTEHSQTMESAMGIHRCSVTRVTTVSIRGHTRWYPLIGVPRSDDRIRAAARKAILGHSLKPSTLYELMPWSWLIDYFSNLGSMIKAHENWLNCRHDIPTIMTYTRTVTSTSNFTSTAPLTISKFGMERETKTRRLVAATLSAREPILSDGQASILGSLSIIKAAKF
nr:MAG: hypothetical protein 1 [Leviviridae sp.]